MSETVVPLEIGVEAGAKKSHDDPSTSGIIPEVEVDPKARRRQFSAKYKLDILKRVSTCVAHGQLGELLRSANGLSILGLEVCASRGRR